MKNLKKKLDEGIAALRQDCAEIVEREKHDPVFEATKRLLQEVWHAEGEPALKELQAV